MPPTWLKRAICTAPWWQDSFRRKDVRVRRNYSVTRKENSEEKRARSELHHQRTERNASLWNRLAWKDVCDRGMISWFAFFSSSVLFFSPWKRQIFVHLQMSKCIFHSQIVLFSGLLFNTRVQGTDLKSSWHRLLTAKVWCSSQNKYSPPNVSELQSLKRVSWLVYHF